ncbi:intelectin-like [Clupea harengus]|uniref:Intelectin-like n=1 Tax=Clupea harengus TaxID=7950 RepID=A0A6P8EVE6_CLUHA|nr:intelectin-like [Clupea harengus]
MLGESVLLSCLALGLCAVANWNTTTQELHKNLNLKRYHSKMRMVGQSCKEIQETFKVKEDGIYFLITESGVVYQTFCDMTTDGGGWTLVASVHENDILGKCTQGDRWSSQNGDNPDKPEGDQSWANRVTFGTADAATDDDYKNPGYYDIQARDVSVWHVPNNEESGLWSNSSFLRYHTETHFLKTYGGNLYHLFKRHPVKHGMAECKGGSGIPIPVVYDKGDEKSTGQLYGPAARAEFEPGFITFSASNSEKAPVAICSGVKPTGCNPQYYCIGGGGYYPIGALVACGDFNAFDWTIFGGAGQHKASQKMIDAAMLLFYR